MRQLEVAARQTETATNSYIEAELKIEGELKAHQKRKLVGFGIAAFAGICYGSLPPLAKWAYGDGANVNALLTIRFVVAMIAVWAVVVWKRPTLKIARWQASGMGLLGLIFVGSASFYYVSLQTIASGTAALLVYIFPALIVVWMALFFGERPNRYKLGALGLALLGCSLTVDPIAVFSSGTKFSWLGVVFALGSALCNSWYAIVAAKFGRGMSGLTVAAWSLPVTTLIFISWRLANGGLDFTMGWVGWLCCLSIGALTALAMVTYLIAVERIGPSRTAITATTEPGTTVLLGILLLGEDMSLIKLVGGVLIITAILILNRS